MSEEGGDCQKGLTGSTDLSVSSTSTDPAPRLQPVHDGLDTLPPSGFPQPPPGAPTELGEHGHREAQDSRRRRGGGHPPPDGLLLTRVAEDQSQPDPGRRLPEE